MRDICSCRVGHRPRGLPRPRLQVTAALGREDGVAEALGLLALRLRRPYVTLYLSLERRWKKEKNALVFLRQTPRPTYTAPSYISASSHQYSTLSRAILQRVFIPKLTHKAPTHLLLMLDPHAAANLHTTSTHAHDTAASNISKRPLCSAQVQTNTHTDSRMHTRHAWFIYNWGDSEPSCTKPSRLHDRVSTDGLRSAEWRLPQRSSNMR